MSSILRAALRAWYAFRLLELRKHRRPQDSAVTRSGDPRADRVLLLGNGFTHGWGVDSHRSALTGRLADALGDRTGRSCDLDVVGAESMNMRSSLAWVGDRDLAAFDAFVISVGLNDALRRTPVEEWERGLRDLLSSVVARLRPKGSALVVGIPPVDALPAFDGLAARIAARHRTRINAATARVAAEYRVSYLDIGEFSKDRRGRLTAAAVYTQLGARIANELAPLVIASRPEDDERAPQADPIWQWSGTEEVVTLATQGGSKVLRRLAETAQKVFKVELAVVSLVNGDRLYYANNTDVMPESVPLDLSFCQYTVASGSPVIIPNVSADARFADNPLTELSYINFYAGYPLHASDGTVIGSFCLQGSRSRPGESVSLEALRGMALQAEAELRRYEKAQPAAPVGPAYTL
ncbi:GDSL-type esterase/lipase family protein [Pseudolysinimonas sp.]|uniref:GDSL-type esterase/lipase family protein n=1 Tax=Pseudolysinimonas sp. TaxID=2680009 RepID=UPI00286BBE39|nr:GDSL-type esterase/lipase family protein [Pseudolysinimonas sp.]